jgi:hypothetical protein
LKRTASSILSASQDLSSWILTPPALLAPASPFELSLWKLLSTQLLPDDLPNTDRVLLRTHPKNGSLACDPLYPLPTLPARDSIPGATPRPLATRTRIISPPTTTHPPHSDRQ